MKITFHLFFLLLVFPRRSLVCCARVKRWEGRKGCAFHVCEYITSTRSYTHTHTFWIQILLLLLVINTCVLVTQLDRFSRARIKTFLLFSVRPQMILIHVYIHSLTHTYVVVSKNHPNVWVFVCVSEKFCLHRRRPKKMSCNPFSAFISRLMLMLMLIMFFREISSRKWREMFSLFPFSWFAWFAWDVSYRRNGKVFDVDVFLGSVWWDF